MTYKLSKLPAPVRVGAHDIKFEHLSESLAKKNFGMFYNGDMKIALAEDYSAGSVAVETMIHEISHAVLSMGGIKDEFQEQICVLIGNGFAQVFRDNPHLMKWIQKTVEQ
jgi:hypothetical protein